MRTATISAQPVRAALASLSLALVLLAPVDPSHAQSNSEGYINGTVTSSTGAVSGAMVTVRNLATGLTRTETSGEMGSYRFSSLPTGRYEVAVTSAGFQSRPIAVNVVVGQSTPVNMVLFGAGEAIDELLVEGQRANFDASLAETATVVTADELDRLPVIRDISAVALMAPGAVIGDTMFGGGADKERSSYGGSYFGLASFGGASVAENAYYINGMNVTNFRNGLGGATVPFNFYDQFQIKTGGFGAEFGRSIGGVVNTVTKRGSNDWDMGVGTYYTPESLRGHSPDVGDPSIPGELDSSYSRDEFDEREIYAYFSGPIVEDRLFFYTTYTSRNNDETNYTGESIIYQDVDDDPFWGLKLDWNIGENHILEYTAFSDKHQTTRTTIGWDEATGEVGDVIGGASIARGGDNRILKYTGHFTDDFTLSILGGEGTYNLTTSSPVDTTCPLIYDSRLGGLTRLGCSVTDIPDAGYDEREVLRLDAEWSIGDRHTLRFGVDSEDNTSISRNFYSGHIGYRYFPAVPGDELNSGGIVPAGVTEVARVRHLEGGGEFGVQTDGVYLEDEWYLNDNLTLRLGVRNETFDNRNAADETFIKITDQWAPRLGISWDMTGDGSAKLYATLGRYYLPIATNTNIRLAGAELFTEDWVALTGLNADDTPVLGAQIGPTIVYSDGSVPDVREVIDTNIKPMFQDEFIIGYEREMWSDYVGGLSFTYRDLVRAIDDVTIDQAIGLPGENHYILTNPGIAAHTFYDADGDGVLEEYNFSAAEMGFPEAKRRYLALTATLERTVSEKLSFTGSYTWSHSYGNVEGYVRSDNGQDDAGLTTNFDFPGLMEGAYGDLPNDRRHQLKFFSSYQFNDNWTIDGSFTYQSGRPVNAFGVHPTDEFAQVYGAESFYMRVSDGPPAVSAFVPRASLGTGEDIQTVNVGFTYQATTGRSRLTARIDVLNLFDSNGVTEIDELADEESGVHSVTYGLPLYFQEPRQVRFGIQYAFGGAAL
jgi:hypothetical protein